MIVLGTTLEKSKIFKVEGTYRFEFIIYVRICAHLVSIPIPTWYTKYK